MNRARLIANLEALLQFSLAHRVRRGDTISLIHLAILPGSDQMICWEACLEDADFPLPSAHNTKGMAMNCNCTDCRAKRTTKEGAMARRRAAMLARVELDRRAGHSINHTLAAAVAAGVSYAAGENI